MTSQLNIDKEVQLFQDFARTGQAGQLSIVLVENSLQVINWNLNRAVLRVDLERKLMQGVKNRKVNEEIRKLAQREGYEFERVDPFPLLSGTNIVCWKWDNMDVDDSPIMTTIEPRPRDFDDVYQEMMSIRSMLEP